MVLRRRFEDPMIASVVKQGCWPVIEYTEEFHDLYIAYFDRGAPNRLPEWYLMAEEAKINMTGNKYQVGRTPPQEKREPFKPQTASAPRPSGCFKCRKEGHCAIQKLPPRSQNACLEENPQNQPPRKRNHFEKQRGHRVSHPFHPRGRNSRTPT